MAAWKEAERRIAKALSIWWTGHPKAFIRSPCSGGWPSARAEGDMVANLSDKTVPQEIKDSAKLFTDTWSMDVKRRVKGSRSKTKSGEQQKWALEELLTAPKHPIIVWWHEICALANSRGTYRFLVMNKATRHSYVVFGEREVNYIKGCLVNQLHYQPEPFQWSEILGPCITVTGASPGVPEVLSVYELRSFLDRVDARVLGGLGHAQEEEGSGA
jgi:hypothetical protein